MQLHVINLGCNKLSCLPVCFMEMPELQNIHLFSNEIEQLDEDVLGKHNNERGGEYPAIVFINAFLYCKSNSLCPMQ